MEFFYSPPPLFTYKHHIEVKCGFHFKAFHQHLNMSDTQNMCDMYLSHGTSLKVMEIAATGI